MTKRCWWGRTGLSGLRQNCGDGLSHLFPHPRLGEQRSGWQGEIETAHHLSQQQGKPVILPVRLAYRDPFAYPLSAYLNGINWAFWESSTDTPRLIQELMQAIAGDALSINTDHFRFELISLAPAASAATEIPRPMPSAQPVSLEMPEGTMDPESRFYVARSTSGDRPQHD